MLRFWLKFWLFMLSLAVFIGCLVFLFVNHADSLIKNVPAEAEMYVHLKITKDQFPKDQLVFNWLEERNAITKEQWARIFGQSSNLGLFSVNKQIHGIIPKSKQTQSLLESLNIPFTVEKQVLFFPELAPSQDKMVDQDWFKNIEQKITSAHVIFYVKDPSTLNLNLVSLNKQIEPAVGLVKFRKNKVLITVLGDLGQTIEKKQQSMLTQLPEETQLYLNNIKTDEISQLLGSQPKNFRFNLLTYFHGPVEYLDLGERFMLIVDKEQNSLDSIKNNIKTALSYFYPVEKTKLLPDETTAIHLIADPSIWKFNAQQELTETRQNLNLKIEETTFNYVILNNLSDFNGFITKTNENQSSVAKFECLPSNFNKKSWLFLNLEQKISLENKNQTKTKICID